MCADIENVREVGMLSRLSGVAGTTRQLQNWTLYCSVAGRAVTVAGAGCSPVAMACSTAASYRILVTPSTVRPTRRFD